MAYEDAEKMAVAIAGSLLAEISNTLEALGDKIMRSGLVEKI
jgi:hypothetical protein